MIAYRNMPKDCTPVLPSKYDFISVNYEVNHITIPIFSDSTIDQKMTGRLA